MSPETYQKTHRVRKSVKIRNRIIQPQMIPMVFTVVVRCWEADTVLGEKDADCVFCLAFSIPVSRAEKSWMHIRTHTIFFCGNCWVMIPKRKAGPALLQKISRCSASIRVSLCSRYASPIACAPAGYPPRDAAISKDSAPSGIPVIFEIGSKFAKFAAYDFKKRDGFLKGNRRAGELALYRQNYCGCEFSYRDRFSQA